MLIWWLNESNSDGGEWTEGKDKIINIKKDYNDWVTSLETNST